MKIFKESYTCCLRERNDAHMPDSFEFVEISFCYEGCSKLVTMKPLGDIRIIFTYS